MAFAGAAANNASAAESTYSPAVQTQTTINLGTGDIGIGNYAFLLEQLEADFYTRVVSSGFFTGATQQERQLLTDIRDHEIIHRELFRSFLGTNAIPVITNFDFSLVNFTNRDSVLTISQIFEDTGVSAYNGAGQHLTSTNLLVLAGKIVSVEARHAAAIRELRIPRTGWFAPEGLDEINDFRTVLNLVAPFLPRNITINADGLPRTIVV